MPTVAILGASRDRQKYGNISLRAHAQQGWKVYPVNPLATEIEGYHVWPDLASIPVRLVRISVYLPPRLTLSQLDAIAAKGADEVWLNPGSADDAVIARAEELGLNVIQACSIVDVGGE